MAGTGKEHAPKRARIANSIDGRLVPVKSPIAALSLPSWHRRRSDSDRRMTTDHCSNARMVSRPNTQEGISMNRSLMFLFASLLCGAVAFATGKTVYDFTMNSIDGQPVQLSAYKGKVLCGECSEQMRIYPSVLSARVSL